MRVLSKCYAPIRRLYLKNLFRVNDKNVTIFSNNCIGGFLYKDMNVSYLSPTVNLQIPLDSFFKYVNNYEYYNSLPLMEGDASQFQDDFTRMDGKKITFPCAWLGDVKILFQHGKSYQDEKEKWEKRVSRINKDNIVVVCWAKKKLLTNDVLCDFSKIKYKKVLITDENVDWPDVEVIKIPKGKNWFDRSFFRLYFEKYNWRRFFNNPSPKKRNETRNHC